MLRKLRIILESLFFLGITVLLLGTTLNFGAWHEPHGLSSHFAWMGRMQFLPSLLAGNFLVVTALVLLTLVFGRIYCSVICPLGSLQDIVNHISSRFHAHKAKNKTVTVEPEKKTPEESRRVAARMAVEDFKSYVAKHSDRDADREKKEELRRELMAVEAEREELGLRREDEPADWKKIEELRQEAEASLSCGTSCSGYLNKGRVVRRKKEMTAEEKEARAKEISEAAYKRRISQRLHFRKELKWLRYTVWAVYAAVLVAGVQVLVSLLAPYSAYGRMVSSVVNPQGWVVPAVAALTLISTGFLAWKGGRTYCNAVCPVGTTLSFFSRFSLFRPAIDRSKCVSCGACEKNCKAQCINSADKTIDYSRCVDCFDCISSCKPGGLKYKFAYGKQVRTVQNSQVDKPEAGSGAGSEKAEGTAVIVDPAVVEIVDPSVSGIVSGVDDSAVTETVVNPSVAEGTVIIEEPVEVSPDEEKVTDSGRRAFISGAVIAGTTLAAGTALSEFSAAAQNMKLDGGLADVLPKKAPKRETPVVPAGAGSVKDFHSHCSACQLCVQNCPNRVLRPSLSFERLMQPEMSFEHGYCRPECVNCSEVCPAGAIKRITPEQKSGTHIGHAVVKLDLCVVNSDSVSCGNCAAHCPAGAVKMVRKNPDDEKSLRIPTVNTERCIGCGACEFLCPARPLSAIHVEGNTVHRG